MNSFFTRIESKRPSPIKSAMARDIRAIELEHKNEGISFLMCMQPMVQSVTGSRESSFMWIEDFLNMAVTCVKSPCGEQRKHAAQMMMDRLLWLADQLDSIREEKAQKENDSPCDCRLM